MALPFGRPSCAFSMDRVMNLTRALTRLFLGRRLPAVHGEVEVEGLSLEESRVLLDRLEAHVLQPQFRYDHLHAAGDVTLWDNYMTLHNSPPIKANIKSLDDTRLLYRLSCKGEPALSLPRCDASEWLQTHIAGGYTTPLETIELA